MVKVDRRSAATAKEEDGSSSSSGSSSYEWVTDSEAEDEEVTAPMVEASLAKTLVALIPFTKAYREANEAMFELNNIKGMQAEVARCKDVKELLDQGLHEEALGEMMTDTTMDFHDFNKTKHVMRQEGTWTYETMRQKLKRIETEAQDKGLGEETAVGAEGHTRKKILIRKIFDAQQKWDLAHTVIDFNSDMNWHGSTNLDEAEDPITGSRKLKHEGCKWRGENDEGVEFMCNNAKLQHPWRTYKDEFGAEVPEQISFCHYHAKFCLDPNKSHGDHLVKIKEPNEFALCNECFVQKKKRPPPNLPKFRIPGVARAARNVSNQAKLAGLSHEAAADALNEETICDWRPNRHIITERGLSCQNKVFRNPETRALCRQCGWHLEECCMVHKDADASKKRITVPNEHGLCVAHYVSKFGHPPKKLNLPYPGMEKKSKDEEKVITIEEQLTHPLRPHGMGPEMADPPTLYISPLKPKGWKQKFKKYGNDKRKRAQITAIGDSSATRIQKNYRMYRCQCLREEKFKQRLALKRHRATVRIQSVARRYIQKEEVEEIKKNTTNAVNLVIRLCRGMLARKKVKRKKAALVLQRGGLRAVASALMFAVKSTLEVRHEHEHEEWGNLTLQRYAKGFVTRLRVRQKREQMKREMWAALCLQKRYRGRIGRRRFDHLSRVKLWEDACATVVQAAVRRALALRYVQHRRVTWNAAAVVIQRFTLMFVAKMVVHHERHSIQMFWDWLAPTLPKDAFDILLPRTFYGSRMYQVNPGDMRGMTMAEKSEYFVKLKEEATMKEGLEALALNPEASTATTASMDQSGEQFFRKYDPDACGQVSRMDFGKALQDMWDSAGCPLLKSESGALLKRFDHHNDGWIDYHRFLRFASRHEKPCAVHGRLICANCISYGQCVKHGMVVCSRFVPQLASPTVCTCGHYVSAHEMIPEPNLDEDYANGTLTKAQMDVIFKKEKKPDLEKPARSGDGMEIGEVLSLTRYQIEKEMARVRKADPTALTNTGKIPIALPPPASLVAYSNAALPPGMTMQKVLNSKPPSLKLSKSLSRSAKFSSFGYSDEDKKDDDSPYSPTSSHGSTFGETHARQRAKTQEIIESTLPQTSLLVERQDHDHLIRHTSTLPNREQHFHSIRYHQYEDLHHMVKSQHAPSYTESVKMVHHEHHLVSYANDTFLKKEQSQAELEKGFKITNPIPLISDGELRLTTKAVDLYLHIFNKVRDEELKLIEDDVAFVNFCFNFIVFLERHWRKLCKDLRLGKLNKRLPISEVQRKKIESAMLPNPKRAKLFEEGLRKLGFHDRASGTKATAKTVEEDEDKNIRKFKKHVIEKIKASEPPATARDHRLPINMNMQLEDRSFISNPTTEKERRKTYAASVKSKTLNALVAEEELIKEQREDDNSSQFGHEYNLVDDMLIETGSMLSNVSSTDSLKHGGSISSVASSKLSRKSKISSGGKSLSSQFNVTDEMRKMTLRDYFTLSLDYDETTDAMNTKFPRKLIRRGSESDLRPMSMQNLFKSGHILKKLPRPVPDDIIVQPQRTVKGFICGHPGCGQVFMSAHSCKQHQKQHELRSRLGIATPLTDQYLLSVFPKDIPWKRHPFKKIEGNAAPYVCPIEGCNKTYPNPEQVKRHMLMGHSKGEVKMFIDKHNKKAAMSVEFYGNFRLVPPFAPPKGVPTLLCPHHAPCNVKCPICLDVIAAKGPVPPIKFYQSAKAVITDPTKNRVAIKFDVSESERGPLIYPRSGHKNLKYTQLKALCVDTLGHNFAAVCTMYTYNDMKNMGFMDWAKFGADAIDRDNELFQESEVSWLRLEDLKGACYALCCERDEYKKRKLMGDLPLDAKFCRYVFDRVTMKPAGKRKDPKDEGETKEDKMMRKMGQW